MACPPIAALKALAGGGKNMEKDKFRQPTSEELSVELGKATLSLELDSLPSCLYTNTMTDGIDNVETSRQKVGNTGINGGVSIATQKPTEFVSPTLEERRKELEEISRLVKGPVKYIPQNGNSITFGQQITEVNQPKPFAAPKVASREINANKVNHQHNVAGLRNTFHKGVWYDSSGIARPRKK